MFLGKILVFQAIPIFLSCYEKGSNWKWMVLQFFSEEFQYFTADPKYYTILLACYLDLFQYHSMHTR